jgi:hypothetical protein
VAQLDFPKLKRMVDNAADLTQDARSLSERDRDYYDGHQWTPSEIAILNKRKQPVLTIERIKRKIDGIVGIEQRGRVDPKALPRNPGDEASADLATQALVFVDDLTRFDAKRSEFCYNLAIEGYGGVEVTVRERNGVLDPEIVRLRWEETFYDPHSREKDFSDAGFMGVQKWMTLDKAVTFCRKFAPDMDEADLEMMLEASFAPQSGDTFEDRPRNETAAWGDRRQSRVKLAYMYYLNRDTWYLALMCGSGTIYNEPSPYLDEDGNPSNAIVLQSCYVDRENRRYGVVRPMISPQDEVNKRRSKLLHMLNSRQTMGHKGAVEDVAKLKRELAAPDGHVEYDQDPSTTVPGFQIIPQTDQIAGQFSLLQESKAEIDMVGPNAALVGKREGKQPSGRADLIEQQAGLTELGPFYDGLRDWTLRVYRMVWCRVKQFWTEPRWIRVTESEDQLQFIGINMPVVDQFGRIQVENAIAELDVDIIIEATPEFATLQAEEFQQLSDLAQSGVPIPPDVLIEASQLRSKAKLLKMLRDPQAQQAQAQQAAMQAEAMQAKTAKDQSQAMLNEAKARSEMAPEPEGSPIDQMSAYVERARAAKDETSAQLNLAKAAEIMARTRQIATDTDISQVKLRPELIKMAAETRAIGQRQQVDAGRE